MCIHSGNIFRTANMFINPQIWPVFEYIGITLAVQPFLSAHVIGDTYGVRDLQFNLTLLARRAESVRNALIEFGAKAHAINHRVDLLISARTPPNPTPEA